MGNGTVTYITTPAFVADFRPAMSLEIVLSSHMLDRELHDQGRLEGNPTLYRVLGEYRFIRTSLDETRTRRDYQLQSIAYSGLLKELITPYVKGYSRQEVTARIVRSSGCTEAEAYEQKLFF